MYTNEQTIIEMNEVSFSNSGPDSYVYRFEISSHIDNRVSLVKALQRKKMLLIMTI